MSAVGEARQRPGRAGWRLGVWPARFLRGLLWFVFAAALLLALGTAVLAWRLSQGPVELGWLARRIEANVTPEDSPTRLHIGQASIAWQGYQEGADQGLQVRLHDLQVVNRDGRQGAALEEADATISLGRLLEFQVVPRTVSLTGLRLRVLRGDDGSISLDLGSLNEGDPDVPDSIGPTFAQTMAELRRPAQTDRSQAEGSQTVRRLESLAQLQRVRVHGADVTVVDQSVGTTLDTTIRDLDLRRQPGGGVRGAADGQVRLGGAAASLKLQAELVPEGGTRLSVALDPVQVADLARADPALAPAGALEATLEAQAWLDLSPRLRPRRAEVRASVGGGRLRSRGAGTRFESVALEAAAAWPEGEMKPGEVQVRRLQLVVPSPNGAWSTTIGLSGNATRHNGRVAGQFAVTLDHVNFADLGGIWPAAWGGPVRAWLTENVTGGTARQGDFRLKLEAPENQLSQLAVTEAGGTLEAEDLTIHWLRPVPPIEHAQGRLRMQNPDVIEIAVPTGRQGAIALSNGLIRFTGLAAKDQFMTVTADLAGQVGDVWTLLRHPRLKLMDRRPISVRNPTGTLNGKISVIQLPMINNLDTDQLNIQAQGRLQALRLPGIAGGRDLDKGEVQFEVNKEGLKASGTANVAGIDGQIGAEMDFRPGPPSQVLQHASLSGLGTARQLAAAGAGVGDVMNAGSAEINANYVVRRDSGAELKFDADLRQAGMALPGWRKPPGPPAQASATLVLKNDKLVGISGLQAQGPGLLVTGRAEMAGSRVGLLRLERLELGPTRATGEVRFPASESEPIRANLSGAVLDLSTQFGGKPSHPAHGQGRGERGRSWIADIRFERLLLAHERSLGGVTAHAEYDGHRVTVLHAVSTGPERLQAVIVPQGQGRRLSIRTADAGSVLRALDVLEMIQGGSLAVEAAYDDRYADPPLAGTVDASEFSVRGAGIGKLLQAITVYGIADAIRGDGLQFSRLIMPFRYTGDLLAIGEARAFSSSLGLTATGRIDTGRNLIDVKGTIVPAYAVNSALGRIPLIGRMFSPERGGGLVAVDYTVRGALSNPGVTVNPLSALTPGFLRGLFKIFD